MKKLMILVVCLLCLLFSNCTSIEYYFIDYFGKANVVDLIRIEVINKDEEKELFEHDNNLNYVKVNYINVIIKDNYNKNVNPDMISTADRLMKRNNILKLIIPNEMQEFFNKYDEFIIQLDIKPGVYTKKILDDIEPTESTWALDCRNSLGSIFAIKDEKLVFHDSFEELTWSLLSYNKYLDDEEEKLENGMTISEFLKWHQKAYYICFKERELYENGEKSLLDKRKKCSCK